MNTVLIVSLNYCETESNQLLTSVSKFYERFANEKVNTSAWIEESGMIPILNSIKALASKASQSNSANVEDEMEGALKIVQEAMRKMQLLLDQSKTYGNKNISPEIIALCQQLMDLIRMLILDATKLQAAVVEAGRMSGISAAEFYHKNSRWTDGLISAAKAVGWVSS